MTLAMAFDPAWLMLMCQRVMPNDWAFSAHFPVRRREGWPVGLRRTSISCHFIPLLQPVPRAFMTASLMAKRAA